MFTSILSNFTIAFKKQRWRKSKQLPHCIHYCLRKESITIASSPYCKQIETRIMKKRTVATGFWEPALSNKSTQKLSQQNITIPLYLPSPLITKCTLVKYPKRMVVPLLQKLLLVYSGYSISPNTNSVDEFPKLSPTIWLWFETAAGFSELLSFFVPLSLRK